MRKGPAYTIRRVERPNPWRISYSTLRIWPLAMTRPEN